MKRVALLSAALLLSVTASFGSGVLVEAESFRDKGGWAVDQQFMDQMGSPYLIAHGMGKPVADAVTTVEFPETSSTSAIGPPTAASGETCPMDAPLDAPEKRPSVIRATLEPSPIPAMAEVGFSISRMPGPPFGPS